MSLRCTGAELESAQDSNQSARIRVMKRRSWRHLSTSAYVQYALPCMPYGLSADQTTLCVVRLTK